MEQPSTTKTSNKLKNYSLYILLAIIYLVAFGLIFMNMTIANQIEEQKVQQKQLEVTKNNYAPDILALNNLRNKLRTADPIITSDANFAHRLDLILSQVGLSNLSDLSYDYNTNFTVKGYAYSLDDVSALVDKFEKSNELAVVRLSNVRFNEITGNYSFEIKFVFK